MNKWDVTCNGIENNNENSPSQFTAKFQFFDKFYHVHFLSQARCYEKTNFEAKFFWKKKSRLQKRENAVS